MGEHYESQSKAPPTIAASLRRSHLLCVLPPRSAEAVTAPENTFRQLRAVEAAPSVPTPLQAPEPISRPKRLAIYYGYPSLVNGANGNMQQALADFSRFDIIVLGETIEDSGHPEHDNTQYLISQLRDRGIEVYGYVNMDARGNGQTIDAAKVHVREWKEMNVTGIFWDNGGSGFGVTSSRRNTLVAYTHEQGLNAFLNVWNPNDLLAPNFSLPTLPDSDLPYAELRPSDIVLVENLFTRDGDKCVFQGEWAAS